MDWLHPFITLTLCCGVALSLLREGSLRRTAALVLGATIALCWLDSLAGLLHWPELSFSSGTALVETGYTAPATASSGGE